MSKRFGKKRVPDCECAYNFTCGPCMRDATPFGLLQGVVQEYVQEVDEDDDEDGGLGLAILERCRAAVMERSAE